jgi:DnaK suppressor protein
MRRMDPDNARRRLEAEHTRLEEVRESLDGISAESEEESLSELSSSDQHQADVGTETFDRERDASILEQVEAELADVVHALKRLDDGTYGTCEACGKPIGEERLEALPAARFCIEDQAVAEREARSAAGLD